MLSQNIIVVYICVNTYRSLWFVKGNEKDDNMAYNVVAEELHG